MAVNRRPFKAADLAYFKAFDRWKRAGNPPDLFRDFLAPDEIRNKAASFKPLLKAEYKLMMAPLDMKEDWDKLVFKLFNKVQRACLYYLFTGDPRAIPPALEVLKAFEDCPRRYWTFSSCIGVLDMDLRTAEVALCLALMKGCFGEALDAGVRRRMAALMVNRILKPGLAAERNKTYPWMASRANWRIILPGTFAIGAMAFSEDCPYNRELIDYAIEAMLVCLGTGDRAGGWNEGPGYWDYGLSYAVLFARSLKVFTGGAVDLFRHPFLKKTGDFRLFMQTAKDEIWNWSDAGKKVTPSITLTGLARAYQNPVYQWAVLRQGIKTLRQLYEFDPALKPVAPPAGQAASRYFPGVGVLVWRGGFGPRDSYVGFQAGDIPHFNHHCQMDFGNLVIHAEGRELLAEVEKWPYAYEGRKDPKVKGAQPGYYDIENKRWMRWDFDYVAALGHNVVTLEGQYPQPFIGARSRFLTVDSGPRHEAVIVDNTSVYKPLAKRVRRYVVYLRPDVILLVDELRAGRPVRARVHFQPGGAVAWGGDAFAIKNGPGQLRGTSLFPAKSDQLVMGLDDRKTTYRPPGGLTEKRLRYLYVENLCRKPRLVFVTALQFGKTGFKPAAYSLQGAPATDDVFTVTVKRGRKSSCAAFDLHRARVAVT